MNCPRCKNSIADTTNVCEWCGDIIIRDNDYNAKNDFDSEMKNLLNGNISYNGKIGVVALVPFTMNKYNCKPIEAKYRVAKWEYFSRIPNANLFGWKKHTIKKTNTFGFMGGLCMIIIPLSVFFFITAFMWSKFTSMADMSQYNN